jgi:NAD-dependent dihydropyrimidine dehydrogenase PreA subunit
VAYVIGGACVDVMDRSCVAECPVDCIYTGRRKLYIQPEECIDCGACEQVCPVDAIAWDRQLPEVDSAHRTDAHSFFYTALHGRDTPLGEPGGAAGAGPAGVDTALVAALPRQAALGPA